MPHIPADLHLRAGGTSVVLHIAENSAPQVLYWGADLGILASRISVSSFRPRYRVLSQEPPTPLPSSL